MNLLHLPNYQGGYRVTCNKCQGVTKSCETTFDEFVVINHCFEQHSLYGEGKKVFLSLCPSCFQSLCGEYIVVSDDKRKPWKTFFVDESSSPKPSVNQEYSAEMTRAEKRIYELILALETVDGYPPNINELMRESGYNYQSSLARVLVRLRDKGWIKSTPQNNHWSIKQWR
jgi:hypothetical protein